MMIPPSRHRCADVTITPFGDSSNRLSMCTSTAASSNVHANRINFYPLELLEPYSVAKAFIASGATVGTDQLDIGAYRMTDLSTGRCDLIRSTGRFYSNFPSVVQESNWAQVIGQAITNGNDSTDSATYTTATVTLAAGKLYLLSIENSHATSAAAVSSIANGPTFTSRSTTQYNTNLNRTSIWSAAPTTNYQGTLVITFGGAQTGCVWALDEFSGAGTTSNDGIVQNAVGTGSSVTPLATLAAFGSVYNCTYGAHGHAAATATTPKAQFTELADATTATPAQALETEWFVGTDVAVNATITSAAWGSCAVEIQAATAPATPWRIARTALDSGANTTDAASFVTTSETFKAGRLYLISFTNTKATTPDAASAVTLTAATTAWASVATKAFSSNGSPTQRLTVYSFVPTADVTDTITVAFGGATQTGFAWSVVEMSGVDTTTTNGVVQAVTGYTDSATTAKADLAAFGDARNATYCVASVNNASAMTAGLGWTQLNTVTYGTPNARMADQWRVDNHRAAASTWTSGAAAIIALEIKCDTSALVIPPTLPGGPNIYMAFDCNGTTATAIASAPAGNMTAGGGVLMLATTFPLPSTCIATTTIGTNIYLTLAGFSTRSLIG